MCVGVCEVRLNSAYLDLLAIKDTATTQKVIIQKFSPFTPSVLGHIMPRFVSGQCLAVGHTSTDKL